MFSPDTTVNSFRGVYRAGGTCVGTMLHACESVITSYSYKFYRISSINNSCHLSKKNLQKKCIDYINRFTFDRTYDFLFQVLRTTYSGTTYLRNHIAEKKMNMYIEPFRA